MVGGDVNIYPVVLLLNYWELRPSLMGLKLDELLKRGITQVGAYVPWQVAESDISHTQTLTRFLQAAAERRMKVFLILSPEVGVHFPNSGLPKDVISRKENVALHSDSGPVVVNLPPNSFALPSVFASDFNKRYYSYIGRMENLFLDLTKTQPNLLKNVTAIMSGSFWKYYRSPLASSQSIFGGNAGDFSPQAIQAYRQRVEHFFSQREFMDPNPSSANQWKLRSLEEVNRRWFYQHAEDVFRNRSFQTLRKRSTGLRILEMEIFTPEADPSLIYSNFLQMVSGGCADFAKLSGIIDEAASRSSFGFSRSVPFVHWTSMGGFRLMSDPEKQFLILKSLLLFGGQGGGLFIDESEWFTLSHSFRARSDVLAQSMQQGEFQLKNRALYLAPHLWSNPGILWDETSKRVFPHMRMISSMDLLLRERNARLLIVDPATIMTRDMVQKLTAWAKAGRVVVIPRNQFYTEMAKEEIERSLAKTKRIEVDIGLTYRLYGLGDGKLIVYDMPTLSSLKGEPLSSWQTFINAILSIAEVENYCQVSDNALKVIPLDREPNGFQSGLAAFVINGTRRKVTADLIFSSQVQVSDLGATLSTPTGANGAEGGGSARHKMEPSNRFSLDVPPFGILPLSVEGLIPSDGLAEGTADGVAEKIERHAAALMSEETQMAAVAAAVSELPGYSPEQGSGSRIEDLWS